MVTMPRSFSFCIVDGEKSLFWYREPSDIPLASYRIYICDHAGNNTKLIETLSPKTTFYRVNEKDLDNFFTIEAVYSNEQTQWQVSPATPAFVPSNAGIPGVDRKTGEQKLPLWFLGLSESEQQSLLEQYYFSTWLKTTPMLSSDPRNVFKDNPSHPPENFVWRDDYNVLFHGDELGKRPEFVFETGLTSAAPVSGKMDMGQRPAEGGLSSFSYYSHTARRYSIFSDDTGFGYIYISTAPGGLNVGLSAQSQRKFDTEAEVAYISGVHTKFILGALKIEENTLKPVAFIQNKNYTPRYMKYNFEPESGDVLIIHSSFPKQSDTITTTENMLKLTNVDTGVIDYYNTTPDIRKNGLDQIYKIEVVSPHLETLNVSGWYMNGVKTNLGSTQVEVRLSEYACDSLLIIEPIFAK